MTRKRRPTVPAMTDLFGNSPATRPALSTDDPEVQYEMLLDQARQAMVQPDLLRGWPFGESAQVTQALLIRADAVRP